jgi:hypothetical protein
MAWTRAQRNEIFQAVRASGLDPGDWDIAEDGDSLTLKYLPSDGRVFFRILQRNKQTFIKQTNLTWYDLSCNPTHREVRNPDKPDGEWRWPGVIRVLEEWTREGYFAITPDRWEQNALRRQLVRAGDAGAYENTPFSDAERLEVGQRLQAMEHELREQGKLTEGIKAALDEAVEASNRLGRKDWKNWFVGAVTSAMIAGTVDRDVATHVLVFVLHGLAHLFGSPPPMLGA